VWALVAKAAELAANTTGRGSRAPNTAPGEPSRWLGKRILRLVGSRIRSLVGRIEDEAKNRDRPPTEDESLRTKRRIA
jgi:hypothetical protein